MQAEMLFQRERYDEARVLYVKYLAEEPNDGDAMAHLSLCHLRLGSFRPARQIAQRAVVADPMNPFVHYVLCLGVLNDHSYLAPLPNTWQGRQRIKGDRRIEAAEDHLLEAIRLDPHHPGFFGQLGIMRLMRHDIDAALDAARQGLAVDPTNRFCHEVRVRVLIHRNELEAAEKAIDGMLREDPEDATAHTLRARIAVQQGDGERSVARALEAKRIDPHDAETHDVLLDAYRMEHALSGKLMRLAQRIHRLKTRWSWWIIGAVLGAMALMIWTLAGIVAIAMNSAWPARIGLGLMGLITIGPLAVLLLSPYLATALLLVDPRARASVGRQTSVEAATVAGMVGVTLMSAIAWLLPWPDAVQWSLFSAGTIIPAWTLLIAADPGDERRIALVWALVTSAIGSVAIGVNIFIPTDLTPALYVMPLPVIFGIAAWLANRPEISER